MSGNNTFTVALKLLTLGFAVIPSGGGDSGKAPRVNWQTYQEHPPTDDELETWQRDLSPTLWGIVTGPVSGVVVVDADTVEARAEIEATGLEPHITTPRGGAHFYFKHPGHHVKTIAGLLPKLDVRADGGFVNVVGMRPDGEYKITRLPTPDTLISWDKLPPRIRKAMDSAKPAWQTTSDVLPIPEGKRNTHLASLAGSMRRHGMPQSAIEAALLEVNSTQCQPSLSEAEVMDIARSISRYEPAPRDEELGAGYIILDKKGNHILGLAKLASDLLFEYQFATFQDTEETLVYRGGVYQSNGVRFIKSECQRLVGVTALLTEHKVNEVIGHIKRSTYVDRDAFNSNKKIINVRNGLLNVETKELQPHTPEFLSTIRIPVEYDPNADCSRIKQFFAEVLEPQDIPVIHELAGYALIPDYSIQRAFLFIGDGSNGKSTLLSLLRTFLGKDNCSSVPWHALEYSRFASSRLDGRLLNIYADLLSRSMNSTGAFKMLTGGDAISAEKKFKDGYSFVNFARLVFSANKPPRILDEDSYAFWRRWIIINFPRQFPENDPKTDLEILSKLTTETELSGLLNLALDGLQEVLTNAKFSYGKTVDQTQSYYLRASDPVYAFVEDCCELDSDAVTSKDALFEAFKNYCKESKTPLMNRDSFAKALKNSPHFRITLTRPTVDGERIQSWKGIKLANSVNPVNPLGVTLRDACGGEANEVNKDIDKVNRSKRKKADQSDRVDQREDIWAGMPDYPHKPCSACGGTDYWPDFKSKRFVCSRCHPKPGGGNRK